MRSKTSFKNTMYPLPFLYLQISYFLRFMDRNNAELNTTPSVFNKTFHPTISLSK